jgi:hypothetical protein
MSRISSATAQQSVSSITENMETAEILMPAQKELSPKPDAHATAEKQNAVTRQKENNLTAMLQKEFINESVARNGGAMGGVDYSLTQEGRLGEENSGNTGGGGASGGVIGDRGGVGGNTTEGGARAGVDM